MRQEYLDVMSVAPTGATTSAGGPGPPSSQGNASTHVPLASKSTLPWCYVVNVNGTDSISSTSSPTQTNASLPSASLGQTNATNTTTGLFNSTAFCAQLLTATPSAILTPTGGSFPRANRRALDITNSPIVSTTSSPHPISSSSSAAPTSSSPVSAPVPTTTSQFSLTASGTSTTPSAVSPVSSAAPSSTSVTASQSPLPVASSPSASVTASSTGLGVPESPPSTPTSTVTTTPESTFSTPVSISETADNHETITLPPFVTTTGLSTLPGGTVTHVPTNSPNQVVSGASSRDSFFGNHAAVVGVFLASGITFAGLALLAFCCFRRRRRRSRRRRSWLPEISDPQLIQSPFSGVTRKHAMGERARPNVRWHRSMLPRDPASVPQSLFSVPLNHSDDNLLAAHGAPVPPPPVQRALYPVPVPYTGAGAHDNGTQVENRRSTGALNEHLPIQIAPPPRLPVQFPSRPLVVHDIVNKPRLSLSVSRASSPSIYPPSPHRSDADSLYPEEGVASSTPKRETSGWLTRGLSSGTTLASGEVHRVDKNAEPPGVQIELMGLNSRPSTASASSSSRVHYSPLESPVSETGTAHTSIRDGIAHSRKFAPQRAPPAALSIHHKSSGAWLRRES